MAEIIVAAFDTETHAEQAVRDLERAGIATAAIARYTEETARENLRPNHDTVGEPQTGGFMAWLFGENHKSTYSASDDRQYYDEHLTAGRRIVRVTAYDKAQATEITRILNQHMPEGLDIEKDVATTGTYGRSAGSDIARDAAITDSTGRSSTAPIVDSRSDQEVRAASTGATTGPLVENRAPLEKTTAAEQIIPLTQEELQVGKQAVQRTRRIRTYVVETPVEETVTLREERVIIDRRVPDSARTTDLPANAFQEREIVVVETVEQPVVEKVARVAEEVVIQREATERTETVRDTVRRQEVEVNETHERQPAATTLEQTPVTQGVTATTSTSGVVPDTAKTTYPPAESEEERIARERGTMRPGGSSAERL